MSKRQHIEDWAAEGRPPSCPACGSPRIARILYGLPDFSRELEEAVSGGTVTLGGCLVIGDDPQWKCLGCGQAIHAAAKRGDRGPKPPQ